MSRKIEAMHEMFGKGQGTCGECGHLLRYRVSSRMISKCEVYGDTSSEASDWAMKWGACGLKDKPYKGRNIINVLKHAPRKSVEEQLDGQMTIDDWLEEEKE